jgi:hypothetical protein
MSENINLNVMSMYQIIHAGYRKGRGQTPSAKTERVSVRKRKGKRREGKRIDKDKSRMKNRRYINE